MQSFNVVTRSNANVVACSPSNLLGQQAFRYLTIRKIGAYINEI